MQSARFLTAIIVHQQSLTFICFTMPLLPRACAAAKPKRYLEWSHAQPRHSE